jgi:cytoplasmic iron level regulating protein YaaA (DUF328/UPF0246 family)
VGDEKRFEKKPTSEPVNNETEVDPLIKNSTEKKVEVLPKAKEEAPVPPVVPVLSKVTQEKYQKAADRQAKLAKENEEVKKEMEKEETKKPNDSYGAADVFAGDKFNELPVNEKLK